MTELWRLIERARNLGIPLQMLLNATGKILLVENIPLRLDHPFGFYWMNTVEFNSFAEAKRYVQDLIIVESVLQH